MTSKNKKEALGTWTIAIIIVHIVCYWNDYMGLDELIPCIIGYAAVWGIIISSISDDGISEGVNEGKKKGINIKALNELRERHAKIDKYIEEGKEVPPELTKSFVAFPLVDDPYKDLE